jgi:hypothetical protein
MNKPGHRAAAAVACAALAVGAAACGGGHGPTSIKAALAEKPPRVPSHIVGISGAEQKDLAPLPRKLRDEIVFSHVRFSTKAGKIVTVATSHHAVTLSATKTVEGAGERGWGCVTTQLFPILPQAAVSALARNPPVGKLLGLVPALRTDVQGISVGRVSGGGVVVIVTIPLKGKNQGIVGGLFTPTSSGTWHINFLTAGQVTRCER